MTVIDSATAGAALQYLTDYSPQDRPWDVHRAQAQQVEGLYEKTVYDQYAERIRGCTGCLGFAWETDPAGEARLKLRSAHFCRVRHCPVCQWRRSLMWMARFLRALPIIEQDHPTARWIFLTLTCRNCQLRELRDTLQYMNESWHRLVKRCEFSSNVLGWVRTTEVTRGRDNRAHPHFHVLLLVKPGYFAGKNYVKQARWAELWRECARLDYTPVVDVRVVKNHRGTPGETPLKRAISETLKYAVKPQDLLRSREWLLELTYQVHGLRFISTGGLLRNVIRENEESDEDLMLLDEGGDSGDPELFFEWKRQIKRYVKL
jgi:plasmid rolling circle replication initiator protein Rep